MEGKKPKHVELKEETLMALNNARAVILKADPSIHRLYDDMVIRIALTDFLTHRRMKNA